MTSTRRSVSAVLLLPLVLLCVLAPAVGASRAPETLPDRYLVVYKDSVEDPDRATAARERSYGFRARHRYSHALKGFAATLNDGQRRALARDRDVDFIAADRPVRATADIAPGEAAPTGIRRIEAAGETGVHAASRVGVAVLDTGIDLSHPDLSGHVAGGTNCIDPGASPQDDEGHGTHVAGTIAAGNDGSGVVGVAPGTTLFAVKVLDAGGSGSISSVVCGIDWVTENAADLGIRVANMSLGGTGTPVAPCATTTDPEHRAICRSTAAGVAYVVAAGNSGWDFDYQPAPDVPAAYPEVIAVTAMSDVDGAPGALGAGCGKEKDDRYASFSNYAATDAGAVHTIAAPGSCIESARLGGGTESMSGTSMASPHVAGALALCMGEGTAGPCADLPADEPSGLIAELTGNRDDASYGFAGDPNAPVSGRYYGHLAWAPVTSSPVDAECTIFGTAGDDTLVGTDGEDVICGLEGNDEIRGHSGADVLRGGAGADRLIGGDGDDALRGEDGTDRLYGQAGNDTLDGGVSNDVLIGGLGSDDVAGGAGSGDLAAYAGRTSSLDLSLNGAADDGETGENDMIHDDVERLAGSIGDDVLTGNAAPNELDGRGGNDALSGAGGNDTVYGGDGDDTLMGGEGADRLVGGQGADSLNGDSADDRLYGQGGNDTLRGGDGNDRLDGDVGSDDFGGGAGSLDLVIYSGRQASLSLSLNDTADDGEDGEHDMIHGDVERLAGGSGDDVIAGNGDNNHLYGRGGDDRISGGGGSDRLHGESGADFLDGIDAPADVDYLYCGSGTDPAPAFDSLDRVAGSCS